MTLSHFLPASDADTVSLDFGVFVAEHARAYRTSQTAIIAALLPVITPSQPDPKQVAPSAATAPGGVTAEVSPASDTSETGGEEPSILPATPSEASETPSPEPQPASTPAVQMRAPLGVNPSPSGAFSTSPAGAEGIVDRQPVPSGGAEAPAAPAPKTQTERVVEAITAHPGWTARQIADLVGIRQERVNNIATKKHLTLRRLTPDEFAQSIRDALQKTKPSFEQDDEAPPPVLTTPYSVAPKIAKRAPQGRFYLRDHDGRFVHQSLQASPTGPGPLMTSDRKWGWYDTMDRYRGAKKVWPQLAFMRKEAVQA